jgi:hypothetical protein
LAIIGFENRFIFLIIWLCVKNKSGGEGDTIIRPKSKIGFPLLSLFEKRFRLGVCYLINASPLFSRELYIPMINIKMSSD